MLKENNPVKILKNGGIGVVKTDTIYGVVGSALSKKSVSRIYKLKGRDENKPFIILISSIKDLQTFGIDTLHLKTRSKILKVVWPGPVSVILPCTSSKFKYLHRGKKSLAFRFPKNKKLINLIKKTGPIVAPSANPQGLIPAEDARKAKKYFGDKVDFYISSGVSKGKASAILNLTHDNPVLLRTGPTLLAVDNF